MAELDPLHFFYNTRMMRFGQGKLARLMLALCVALTVAVMPILSQQVMAAHHAGEAVDVRSVRAELGAHTIGADCEEKQTGTSEEADMSCCDMSCSTVVAFDQQEELQFGSFVSGYYADVADELHSRVNFGLKRPPKA